MTGAVAGLCATYEASAILAAAVCCAPPASLFFQPLVVRALEPLPLTNDRPHGPADIAEALLAVLLYRRHILLGQRIAALIAMHGIT